MINKIIRYSMIGLGVIILILALTVFFQYKKLQYIKLFSAVDTKVQLELSKLGLPVVEKEIKQRGLFPPHPVAEVKIKIPLDFSLDALLMNLRDRFKPSILNLREENLKDTYNIHIELGRREIITHKLLFSLEKAKVALLIDDFGYTNDNRLLQAFFKDLSIPFTVSIIPGTRFADEIAKIAHQEGKQIIVHMPMQPKGNFNNQYKWIIMEGMSRSRIKEQIKEAVESIPYAEGLNNHMGSLVTSKKNLMEPILEVLKEKRMFFVDSRTSSLSVGYSLAKDMGVRSTFRCVFLDNTRDTKYIKSQFEKLILEALRRGWVLGLGHSDVTTAHTLRELVETCDNRKINFVPVSEVLR